MITSGGCASGAGPQGNGLVATARLNRYAQGVEGGPLAHSLDFRAAEPVGGGHQMIDPGLFGERLAAEADLEDLPSPRRIGQRYVEK